MKVVGYELKGKLIGKTIKSPSIILEEKSERYILTSEEKRALAQLESDEKLLSSALEKIKQDLWTQYWATESHESKAREEIYHLGNLIGRFKGLIQKSVNETNKENK